MPKINDDDPIGKVETRLLGEINAKFVQLKACFDSKHVIYNQHRAFISQAKMEYGVDPTDNLNHKRRTHLSFADFWLNKVLKKNEDQLRK